MNRPNQPQLLRRALALVVCALFLLQPLVVAASSCTIRSWIAGSQGCCCQSMASGHSCCAPHSNTTAPAHPRRGAQLERPCACGALASTQISTPVLNGSRTAQGTNLQAPALIALAFAVQIAQTLRALEPSAAPPSILFAQRPAPPDCASRTRLARGINAALAVHSCSRT